MDTTHGHGNLVQRELSSEQEEQKEQNDAYRVEVPEGAMATAWSGWLAYGASSYFNKREQALNAFKRINEEHFEHELLKVRDPVTFEKLAFDFETAKIEIEKQRKSNGKKAKDKQLDYAQVGILPIKQYRERVNYNDFDHKEQAFKLASTVQNKIKNDELNLKVQKTAATYGLDYTSLTKLTKDFETWKKQAPNANFDDYLHSYGRRLHLEQKLDKEFKGDQKGFAAKRKKENAINALARKESKELKEKSEILFKDFETTRVETFKANKDQIIEAQKQIKDLLDVNKPLDSKEVLDARIEKTLNPIVASTIKPTSQSGTKSTAFSTPPVHEKVQEGPITPSIKPQQPPVVPKVEVPVQTVVSATPLHRIGDLNPKIPQSSSGAISQIPFLKNISMKIFGGKLAGFSTSKLISKGLTFAATKLGLGAATGGAYTIASLVAGLVGIDLDKFVLYAAGFVVAVPVGLMIFMLSSPQLKDALQQSSPIPTPIKVSVSNNSNNNLSISWEEFEEKYLGLDSDRHYYVKK